MSISFEEFQRKFYKSKEWRTLRKLVTDRDNFTCRRCGKLILKSRECHIDHIQEITSKNMNDKNITLNAANLQTLCIQCHNVKTSMDKLKTTDKRSGIDWDRRDEYEGI